MNNMVKIRKIVKFYHVFDEDTYILHYIFDYKIKGDRLGFPDKALDKVIDELESNRVSFVIIGENINREYDNDNYSKYIELGINKYKVSRLIEDIEYNIRKLSLDKLERVNDIVNCI